MLAQGREKVELLIVGHHGQTHIGSSLARAAERLGIAFTFVDSGRAFAAPRLLRLLTWRLGGHRPPLRSVVDREILSACLRWRPRWLLSTGLAPIGASTLASVGRLGVQRLNYLTDDPWNPTLRSAWFFQAMRHYDHIFSPRRANMADLAAHSRARVTYLPFGFDPELSFPQEPDSPEEWSQLAADVAFVGGADRDRIPFIDALVRDGLQVALYGGYWHRFAVTRRQARGNADVATIRKATSAAKVSLCLVRRANRDGHVMRSLEIAAMQGCLLAEDTGEHRALFGPPGVAATYFSGLPEMLDRVRWLLGSAAERHRLALAARHVVVQGGHTYEDRLRAMLGTTELSHTTDRPTDKVVAS